MSVVPRISIVTPCFNQGEFLEECIDSVLSQNYPNLEYMVLDGGSQDRSPEIIRKYEKYLAFWRSHPDGGQYQAIEEGLGKSTGEILSWLNADDKYHHHALFKVAYLFSGRDDIEWLTGRPSLWDQTGRIAYILYQSLPTFSRRNYLDKQYRVSCIQQEGTFWRRSLWEKAGSSLRTDLVYAGDLELWVRFFRFAPLYTIDTLLAGFRRHEKQKTANHIEEYWREADRIIDEELLSIEKNGNPDAVSEPEPIGLDCSALNEFIDSAYRSNPYSLYRLADGNDELVTFLIQGLDESERDRAARLNIINSIDARLRESEKDRLDKSEQVSILTAKVTQLENQLAAEIARLEERLNHCESDRAARLEVINRFIAQLEESEADRKRKQHSIEEQGKEIHSLHLSLQELRENLHRIRSSRVYRLLRRIRLIPM